MASQNENFAKQLVAQAEALLQSGHLEEAMAGFAQATTLAPAEPAPYLGRGNICWAAGLYDEALYWFENALERAPNLTPALEGVGDALLALGRPIEAFPIFEKLLRLNEKSGSARRGAGEALKQLGRIEEARAMLAQAVQLAPGNTGYHYALAQIGRFVEHDPRLPALEMLAARAGTLPDPARCELHFSLGKAYDDLGRYEEAFAQFSAGNAIKWRHIEYNEAMFLGILSDLAAAFTAEAVAARSGIGDTSEVPVFVIGMPRSGTSLVEQILASHPAAFGAGELMVLHKLLGQNLAGPDFPAHFSGVSNTALRKLGSLYVAHLRRQAPQAARIADKLPANFMLCGLIHSILPHAKIIHVRRDPLDTCFSCFTNLFSQNIDYSYDLAELGRYYRAYDALMEHWHQVLPEGTILDISYEALVQNFEPEARRIVDYIGLPWDEACLSFHRTKRVVHTLSATQVRQPLYQSSVARAAPYAAWLTPLRQALSD